MLDQERPIPFTCTLDCGSRCALVARARDGGGIRIDTPAGEPDTVQRPRLVPCVRGRAHGRLQSARERVLHPLRRSGARGAGAFEPVSWDEALDTVATWLNDLARRDGPTAVLHATGAGSISGRGFSGGAASERFFSYWGSVTATSGNLSNHCASIAADWMLGTRVPGSDRATLLDARLIILWGMNPAETWMGPNTGHYIAGARDRGAHVILIDPRYTDSGILADQWVPVRPGTDAALAAAMAYVMEREGLVDRASIASMTTGYETYRAYLLGEGDGAPKTPAWAEAITGVPRQTIAQLARDYATTRPAALLPGWGPQRTLHGEQFARAAIVLACMSGNVGVRGGGLASLGTRDGGIPAGALPRGPYAPARRISAVTWARDLLEDRLDPPVRMAYVVASNLINRSPNTRANARALAALDHVVVHEPFLTPTARYADIVFPICTDLERADLVTSWGYDAHLFYSQQVAPAQGEARTDYWVCAQLAERLGLGAAYTGGKTEGAWIETLLEAGRLDAGHLRDQGILRQDPEPRVALAAFRADPVAHPLPTPSGRIEIVCPQAEAAGLPTIPSYVLDPPHPAGYPLQLVTPHSKLRSNSCLHANPWLQDLEPHAVWIHPRDAAARGVAQGATVEVWNDQGAIRLPAKLTERIMPGVVCVHQGTWYRPGADGVDEGGCANVLTDHVASPSGGLATHSAWVEVRQGHS
ncbi:MAG: molybdopterin-dependent oxidoreductase [Anaerolineae bacterium]|nr:molybdopterin-dependent oxidoreductase [Anaerolineae bacterium]